MKKKVKEWAKRYVPGEVTGTIGAIAAAFFAYALTSNYVVSAFAGTWGENAGYYGFMSARDVHISRKDHERRGHAYGISSFFRNIRNLIVEFGFAELFDSFLLRPFFMYVFPIVLGNFVLGVVVGKIAADIVFYIPVIAAYELRKKHLKN